MDRLEKVGFGAFTTPPSIASIDPGYSVNEITNIHRHQLIKKYERGDLSHVDWLDKLVFREIENIHKVDIYLCLFSLPHPGPKRVIILIQ